MNLWHLYPTISAPMPFQMALDEILFRRLDLLPELSNVGPSLRFYFSSEPWTTIGYSDPMKEQDEKLKICRRITGGGRVLHGKDIVFSISARKEHDESFASVRMSYLKIHEAVKLALEEAGLKPRFYRCDENLGRGQECFLFPIATDLEVEGRKIAGGAQKRSSGKLLHQESIQLERRLEADPLIKRLSAAFEKVFKVKLVPEDLDPELMVQAAELEDEKYSQKKGPEGDPALELVLCDI